MTTQTEHRRINQAGLELIKGFESFQPERYICPAGKPTIGYGHVIGTEEHFDQPLSQQQAEDLLAQDLSRFEGAVARLVTSSLGENQFAALVSFTFNLGEGSLASSTLLRKLNAGDYQGAASEFPKWVKITKKDKGGKEYKETSPGLVRRRQAEAELFLS